MTYGPNLQIKYEELVKKLIELTKQWNPFDDVPEVQQKECREIGEAFNELGGIDVMREAYYRVKAINQCCSVMAAYWDGIGEWKW